MAAAVPSASMATLPPSTSCTRASSQCGPLSPSRPVLLHSGLARFPLSHMSGSSLLTAKSSRHSVGLVRATTSPEESGVPEATQQLQELFDDLKAKYDSLENKSQVWIYGGGALFALWLSSAIVGAVNGIPVLPKVLEFVGLCYSGWFVYRYLLFKSSRKQLAVEIEELKLKITGVPRSAFMTEDDE